jgi:arsenite/tail-anchored protein-transporting ATPase
VLLAERGHKTLLLSTDPAHSLADALGVPLGPEPREVAAGLAALQVDPQRRMESSWHTVLAHLAEPLAQGGADALAADEVAVFPGADDALALLELRDHALGGPWDAVVLDAPSTAATLKLLALPETLSWYVRRAFPIEARIARAMHEGAGLSSADRLLDAADRLAGELGEVAALLADPARTTIRVVLTPESVVLAEARRMATALALRGHRIAELIANRVIPDPEPGPAPDPWRAGWAGQQAKVLGDIGTSFPDTPLRLLPYWPSEPVGLAALLALGTELYAEHDPDAAGILTPTSAVVREGADFLLRLELPFADRSDVGLGRSGDELVLTVGGHRRLLTLPSGLRRCIAVGAAVHDGTLEIRFTPDPEQWPK